MGYYSHVITDLAIHAVVYKLVGGCYENHKKQHLHSEVVQDSLLFYDVYNIPPNAPKELVDANFLQILRKCQEFTVSAFDPLNSATYVLDKDIVGFWDSILRQNYPPFYKADPPKISEWHKWYSFIVKEGTGLPARWLEPNMAYHKTTEIASTEKTSYYTDMVLPDNSANKSYRNDVFNKTVAEVTRRLKDFLNSLDNTDAYLALKKTLGDWNIDKGTVDGNNPQFALWNGKTEFPFNCPGDPPQSVSK